MGLDQKWKDGINSAILPKNKDKWNKWDSDILQTVQLFNASFMVSSAVRSIDYPGLNWIFVKAMAWVETGAGNPEWNSKPLQIGVPGDPGLDALLGGKEGGELILPSAWKKDMTKNKVLTDPIWNIRAGVAYLLMRLAKYDFEDVYDEKDSTTHTDTVKAGDTLSKIAKRCSTTVSVLKAQNPGLDERKLKPGQKLLYRKASNEKVIIGWRDINAETIAERYNGGGDAEYAVKLRYAFEVITGEAKQR